MKRIFPCLTAIFIILITSCTALADSRDFYCEYTPKTATGSVFYIDVFSKNDVSSAVMDLSFDSSTAEFRGVSASSQSSSVRYQNEKDHTRIAFADSGAVNGQLFRVSFKALKTGSCTFTLRTSQSVDSSLQKSTDIPDYTLTIQLGKDDITSSAKSSSTTKSVQKDVSSKRSDISYGDINNDDNSLSPQGTDVVDVRKSHVWTYILIGIGAALLIVLSVVLGIRLGKKRMNNTNDEANEDPLQSSLDESEDQISQTDTDDDENIDSRSDTES